jgi:hypothetical protein
MQRETIEKSETMETIEGLSLTGEDPSIVEPDGDG